MFLVHQSVLWPSVGRVPAYCWTFLNFRVVGIFLYDTTNFVHPSLRCRQQNLFCGSECLLKIYKIYDQNTESFLIIQNAMTRWILQGTAVRRCTYLPEQHFLLTEFQRVSVLHFYSRFQLAHHNFEAWGTPTTIITKMTLKDEMTLVDLESI